MKILSIALFAIFLSACTSEKPETSEKPQKDTVFIVKEMEKEVEVEKKVEVIKEVVREPTEAEFQEKAVKKEKRSAKNLLVITESHLDSKAFERMGIKFTLANRSQHLRFSQVGIDVHVWDKNGNKRFVIPKKLNDLTLLPGEQTTKKIKISDFNFDDKVKVEISSFNTTEN